MYLEVLVLAVFESPEPLGLMGVSALSLRKESTNSLINDTSKESLELQSRPESIFLYIFF